MPLPENAAPAMADLPPDNPYAAGAAYLDGRYMPVGQAAIPITDWGYRRSDVTYDVVGVWEGRFFRLDDHIGRFRASMRKLRLDPAESDDEIRTILHRCVALSRLQNAYVAMDCLRGRPAANGVRAKVVVMRSNGGEMTLESAVASPIQIAVSGPTGGVIAAKRTAEVIGLPNLVTLDMGGTSTDVATIVNGREKFTTDFEIEWGRPIQIPMIDIRTIGAGGGSIARIDAGGMLVVGPESAGANPGPACYGNGGTLPTVTDANVVLGRISAQNFLGGTMRLDPAAARTAITGIATALGLSVEEAALAIVRIANNNMVGALHTVLTEQGLDPRDFVLVAFGGAGPPHLSDLMTEASIPEGLVPKPGEPEPIGLV